MNNCCGEQMKEVKRKDYKIYSCIKCDNIHTEGDLSMYQKEDKETDNTLT